MNPKQFITRLTLSVVAIGLFFAAALPASAATKKTAVYAAPTYYVNVSNIKVPVPVKAPAVPIGASAKCRDGSYSFSQHRSGTCSHHGGVGKWL